MSLKLGPFNEYVLYRLRLEIGFRVKHGEIDLEHESAPIHLDVNSSFIGGVKQQISIIKSIINKIYAADTVELRHSTIDMDKMKEIVSGGAVITIKDLTIFRSVISVFSIQYKKIHGKSTKVYELLDVTIV